MTFKSELLDALGDSNATHDISVSVARCFFYDFDGIPVRLWEGEGKLFAGGHEWIGTTDGNGQQRHDVPPVRSTRDGSSPDYAFVIPYIDAATYAALKADQDLCRGRTVTCYHVIVKNGEGMRPGTALRFAYQLTMQSPTFSEGVENTDGHVVNVLTATIKARADEVGRSRTPNGTYTDTAQQDIARRNAIASDSFCAYVAGNSRRTIQLGR